MAVTIRDATAEDAREIAEVHVASWRWAYRGQLPDEVLNDLSIDEREAMWTAWFRGSETRAAVLVAQDEGGRVVGFANAGASRDQDAAPGTGELRAIYLVRDVQGTGVGRRLLDASLDRLRSADFDRVTLWVLATNDLGRRFYEKTGWRWDGTTSAHRFECANRPILRYARDL